MAEDQRLRTGFPVDCAVATSSWCCMIPSASANSSGDTNDTATPDAPCAGHGNHGAGLAMGYSQRRTEGTVAVVVDRGAVGWWLRTARAVRPAESTQPRTAHTPSEKSSLNSARECGCDGGERAWSHIKNLKNYGITAWPARLGCGPRAQHHQQPPFARRRRAMQRPAAAAQTAAVR